MKTLKQIREDKGIKQVSVAQYLGVARQTYAEYENHPEKMTYPQMLAVCRFINCKIEDFFCVSRD